jgi:1-deoxy-D-xylulose-5-phosphate synthase
MIVSAPKDGEELRNLLYTATKAGAPMAIRYPRGGEEACEIDAEFHTLPVGKAEILRRGDDVALFAIGNTVNTAILASDILEKLGIECSVVNARYVKPLDEETLLDISRITGKVLTIEENTLEGGFGSAVLQLIAKSELNEVTAKCMGLPDEFIEHGTQILLRSKYGLDTEGIVKKVLTLCSDLPENLGTHVEGKTC